ncbi:MAG: PAS domain S-box protein [Chloroflexi bacterium]|nr:PAS domain S-box protein [Chloroflexota bacterium]
MAILHDVTERLRAEEAYRTVVDRSLQGFAILQDGRVVFANHTFFRMFGSDPSMIAEFNAGRIADGVHPEDLPRVLDGMQRLASHEIDVVRGEFRLLTKTQEAVWVEIQAAHTDYHGASAVQIALVDITEQRLARQHELDAQLNGNGLRWSHNSVTGAAHELRTPLSIINTQAYLMARLADAGDRQRSAALIAAQVFRTSRLVDVMLKMARLQRSSPKLIPIVPGTLYARHARRSIRRVGLSRRDPSRRQRFSGTWSCFSRRSRR